jgi:hypothetical protein
VLGKFWQLFQSNEVAHGLVQSQYVAIHLRMNKALHGAIDDDAPFDPKRYYYYQQSQYPFYVVISLFSAKKLAAQDWIRDVKRAGPGSRHRNTLIPIPFHHMLSSSIIISYRSWP